MSATKKSQRTFLTVTLLTVMAVTTVFVVYAAVLLTLTGTTVTVIQEGGSVEYNLDNASNSSWVGSLPSINTGTEWYARINITNAAAQDVTVNWTLEQNTGSWVPVSTPVNTTITLSAGDNTIYATATGVFTGNYNWGGLTTSDGSYRVKATVNG
ncbi:MAG TPA: hypothetical protein VJ249_07350 [Candidatus Bathyarchaeia archaeon]|nr:hypothetical protein [Candidatus Bathyarchaeia archaeon]